MEDSAPEQPSEDTVGCSIESTDVAIPLSYSSCVMTPWLQHGRQDRVSAFLGGFGVGERVVLDGRLNEAGEERGLQVVQFGGRLREVALRGGLDAVGDGAEGGNGSGSP